MYVQYNLWHSTQYYLKITAYFLQVFVGFYIFIILKIKSHFKCSKLRVINKKCCKTYIKGFKFIANMLHTFRNLF